MSILLTGEFGAKQLGNKKPSGYEGSKKTSQALGVRCLSADFYPMSRLLYNPLYELPGSATARLPLPYNLINFPLAEKDTLHDKESPRQKLLEN